MFVLYHMSWERKPSYTSLTFDGSFQSWNEALKCAFENVLNGDVDTGEIPYPSYPPPKTFTDPVPQSSEAIKSLFPNIFFAKYHHEEFTEFWFEERCYHIKKIN